MMMKKLCRIRLINWHYFVSETISVNGSFLISGENTSGKSTVLDAIQLVLTTNTRKFNIAANEKSNRNLKGYVRGKTGIEDNFYLRDGVVISYVALEFYEEKKDRYFTLGVKIDSYDEESNLIVKWYRQECKLDDLSFITDDRPSETEEFRRDNEKVYLITQKTEAKAQFGQRLGNLEDRFFDMIPKSLAFKPMDNVKKFINNFILTEKTIEVSTLRENIKVLKELEDTMYLTKEKISELDNILSYNTEVTSKDRIILINNILIKKSELELQIKEEEKLKKKTCILNQTLIDQQNTLKVLKSNVESEREKLTNLRITFQNNETTELVTSIKHRIEILTKDKENAHSGVQKLNEIVRRVNDTIKLLNTNSILIKNKEEVYNIMSEDVKLQNKIQLIYDLENKFNNIQEDYSSKITRSNDLLSDYIIQKMSIKKEIKNLKNKKLTYPENTIKLKGAIEKEFLNQGIDSSVRIFSNLLEITDNNWQNAVEGYLNSQRFYIIVEPIHYSLALDVYNRIKREVHTVGLVNTSKLDINEVANNNSLAYIVSSENRYAKAYAIYLMNDVIRCDDLKSIKEHKVAITSDCMLYKNFAVRKINSDVYKTPFIGTHAYETHLKNKEIELKDLNSNIVKAENNLIVFKKIINNISRCKFETLIENIGLPKIFKEASDSIAKESMELKKLEDNPNYVEIKVKIEESENSLKWTDNKLFNIIKDANSSEEQIKNNEKAISGGTPRYV